MTEKSANVLSRRDIHELMSIAASLQVASGHLEGLQLKLDDYVTTCTDLVVATDHFYDALAHITEAWEAIYDAIGITQDDLDHGFGEAS